MKYLLLSFSFLLFLNFQTSAEPLQGQAKLDSLLSELPKARGDTNEVKLLDNISFSYYSINPDKGIEYGQKGLIIARKINWRIGEAKCFNSIGANYYIQSNYSIALKYYLKALKINNELGNKDGISRNFGNIGIIYLNQSNYPKALGYYFKALKIYEELGKINNITVIHGNIGAIYNNQSNYSKALEYFLKALKIFEELEDKRGIAANLGNIGIVYKNQSNYPKALKYYFKALNFSVEIGDEDNIASNLGNIGIVYKNQLNYPKALEYFYRALKIYEELGSKDGIAINLGNIGELYLAKYKDSIFNSGENRTELLLNRELNLNKAIKYSNQAIALSKEIGELNNQSLFLSNLAEAYKLKGDYKKAYNTLEEYHKLKDSVFSQKNADKIATLEKSREDDLKQKEIEKQKAINAEQKKREQLIIYFSIGFFIVMSIVMFVIYRLLKRSDKLLYNVLPVSIAKRLKKKEHPISDNFTQASIIFIDIVNFTVLSRDADPQRIVLELNKIFTHFDTIADKYGLEKIKTIGDSYMAAAGIPEIQEDNTHSAAQMALEVKELMEDYHTADGTKIEVRIGLDCGPVVAGVIGEKKFIYDMWSDAVNTASRMESSSVAGEIQVSERFKTAVSKYQDFAYIERGEIEIKGKGKMKTYFMGSVKIEA